MQIFLLIYLCILSKSCPTQSNWANCKYQKTIWKKSGSSGKCQEHELSGFLLEKIEKFDVFKGSSHWQVGQGDETTEKNHEWIHHLQALFWNAEAEKYSVGWKPKGSFWSY